MSDDRTPQEITLELIFRQGQRVLAELGGLRQSFTELTGRVGRLERAVAALHSDFAELSTRLDGLDQRLQRIEQRLELVDSPK